MFNSNRESTGTWSTETLALLGSAFIFTALFVSRPFGYAAWATAYGVACTVLAWKPWKITIPSLTPSLAGRAQ